MPAAASLTNNASVQAFVCPAGSLGFILWNTSAANLRWRIAKTAAASSTNEGIPLPAPLMRPPLRR